MAKLILAVLASTKGTDMQAVIDSIKAKKLNAQIACVISNKEDAFALERARSHGIEAIFLDPKNFKGKEEYDAEIVRLLNERKVQLVLLIGYNKFVTAPLLDAFRNKMMNIHPSLLPSFKGWDKNVHQEVLDAGCKASGCTLFFVTANPDAGPIIAQKAVEVAEGETVDSLKEKVQRAEQDVILKAIKLFANGKLKVEGNKVKVLK
ncbi:MAG: phosphoribosylglycinamide formyltransferase [Candidatus Diapherotrites archaeon]|nr:phosphoribosylglycinamide formyltransferase [Candidatus Diapherotrites archaeon]